MVVLSGRPGHTYICVALEGLEREKSAATMLAFPNFYGRKHKNASYFLDDLEMALLASGQDEDEVVVDSSNESTRQRAACTYYDHTPTPCP